MARDFSDIATLPTQDSVETEQDWLDEAIEMVRACCKVNNTNIIINEEDFCPFPDEDTDVFDREEILEAINHIADYCWETDSVVLVTKDFFVSSRIKAN